MILKSGYIIVHPTASIGAPPIGVPTYMGNGPIPEFRQPSFEIVFNLWSVGQDIAPDCIGRVQSASPGCEISVTDKHSNSGIAYI